MQSLCYSLDFSWIQEPFWSAKRPQRVQPQQITGRGVSSGGISSRTTTPGTPTCACSSAQEEGSVSGSGGWKLPGCGEAAHLCALTSALWYRIADSFLQLIQVGSI